jgi:hypothetical protein
MSTSHIPSQVGIDRLTRLKPIVSQALLGANEVPNKHARLAVIITLGRQAKQCLRLMEVGSPPAVMQELMCSFHVFI